MKILQAIEFAIHTNSLGSISTCVDTTLPLQVEFRAKTNEDFNPCEIRLQSNVGLIFLQAYKLSKPNKDYLKV